MNKQRGEVRILLDGIWYEMRPTFNAIAEIEADLDKGIISLAKDFHSGMITLSALSSVAYFGLKAAGNKVDRAILEEKIVRTGFNNLITPVSEFIANCISGYEKR